MSGGSYSVHYDSLNWGFLFMGDFCGFESCMECDVVGG